MSRIGRKHIDLPENVSVAVDGYKVTVKGPKGELNKTFNNLVHVEVKENKVFVTRINEEKHTKQMHGTTRALINNMVVGVSEGFQKEMKIIGTGYKCIKDGNKLTLNLGYSNPVVMEITEGIDINVVSPTEFVVSGIDKEKVGQFAAEARAKREPEPYHGKGVRYKTEHVRIKETKKASATAK